MGMVKLANGATTVAEYEYDATKQRIVKSIYASGTLDHREHFYYNDNWQVTEIRKEVSGTEDVDPLSQYVWHPYYVDALILRDYDSDTDGTSFRYYYTQDTIFNVVSILNASGTVLERYGYTPYGQAEVLDGNFSADSDGLSDMANDVTFTGQRFDPESGLMLYRHRFYHPVIGTFCSKDPIGYKDGKNLYRAYFAMRGTDPSGTEVKICFRSTNIPLLGILGFPHSWIKTDTESCGRGTIDGKCLGQCPCSENQQNDHSGEPTTDCKTPEEIFKAQPGGGPNGTQCGHRVVPGSCSEGCVNAELSPGKKVPGRFFPYWNDCHTFVEDVVKKCCRYEWIAPAVHCPPDYGVGMF